MNITLTKAIADHTMEIEYSYTVSNWGKIMLILGYTAGAVLILATVIMIILVTKKHRTEGEERRRRR